MWFSLPVVVKNTEIILKDNYAISSIIETITAFYWAKYSASVRFMDLGKRNVERRIYADALSLKSGQLVINDSYEIYVYSQHEKKSCLKVRLLGLLLKSSAFWFHSLQVGICKIDASYIRSHRLSSINI